ncbi:DNA methyltransferase [Glycomyces sp. NPDC047010]|uniref:TRM11 family SAM-dependent methyltransferase n=1 Tax=Glycomyces sp. NPDC047010 TaxID=3155023 RepID=UPI0033C89B73
MRSPKLPRPTVWATGQIQPARQRGTAYVAGRRHPAKMWPAIARSAIERYSRPGEVVLDPMAGVGTTLVEGILAGRNAYGVDLEAGWVEQARANAEAAMRQQPTCWGEVFQGDAGNLAVLLEGKQLAAPVDMVLTSPPYGAVTHGQPDTARVTGGAIRNRDHRYSEGRASAASLVTSSLPRLEGGLERVFAGCAAALKPGGFMVVTARPFTHQKRLIDFPSLVIRAGLAAGFDLHERCAALLSRWDGHILHPHATFFHLTNTRGARAAGRTVLLRAHEDVLVFRRPS